MNSLSHLQIHPSFLLGIIFCLSGLLLRFFPPKKINNWYGYRTSSSKQNQTRWDFAQKESGKLLTVFGIIQILVSFLLKRYVYSSSLNTYIAIGLMLLFSLVMIIIVEYKLKELEI